MPVADNNKGWFARREMLTSTFNAGATSFGRGEFVIPLDCYFSFLKHFHSALFGCKMSFEFTKKSTTVDSVFSSTSNITGTPANNVLGAAASLFIDDLTIYMPKVMPSVETEVRLRKMILDKTMYVAPYYDIESQYQACTNSNAFQMKLNLRSGNNRPRFIIAAFQDTGVHQGTVYTNPSIFCKASPDGAAGSVAVKNAFVLINGVRYKNVDLNEDIKQGQVMSSYASFSRFMGKYYLNDTTKKPAITPMEWARLYQIYVFDVSKSSENLKASVLDITLRFEFQAPIVATTNCYALTVSDRVLQISSTGTRQVVQQA